MKEKLEEESGPVTDDEIGVPEMDSYLTASTKYKTVTCWHCGGHGMYSRYSQNDFEGAEECSVCGGKGFVYETPKGRYVEYPGGRFCGRKSRTELLPRNLTVLALTFWLLTSLIATAGTPTPTPTPPPLSPLPVLYSATAAGKTVVIKGLINNSHYTLTITFDMQVDMAQFSATPKPTAVPTATTTP